MPKLPSGTTVVILVKQNPHPAAGAMMVMRGGENLRPLQFIYARRDHYANWFRAASLRQSLLG